MVKRLEDEIRQQVGGLGNPEQIKSNIYFDDRFSNLCKLLPSGSLPSFKLKKHDEKFDHGPTEINLSGLHDDSMPQLEIAIKTDSVWRRSSDIQAQEHEILR